MELTRIAGGPCGNTSGDDGDDCGMDYSRYLFGWCIPGNVEAGEDYRIVDVTDHELELPRQDFWLFDESVVVHMNYRPDGTQINRELLRDPDIGQYLQWRDTAVAAGIPFTEWNRART